jgi:ADP-ribose pyrophosphatase YjhB (NUDIX family)
MFSGHRKIKVKSICLFENEGKLFVSKSYDSVKKDFYYRPIGGTVEFGERAEDAVIREIREELNAEVKNVVLADVMENIFDCDGLNGHEIVFLFRAEFADRSFYEDREFTIVESNGESLKAFWIPIPDFLTGGRRLVPEKLISRYADIRTG